MPSEDIISKGNARGFDIPVIYYAQSESNPYRVEINHA
jgi:hypothetical protein